MSNMVDSIDYPRSRFVEPMIWGRRFFASILYDGRLDIAFPGAGITAAEIKAALFRLGVTRLDINQIKRIASKNGNNLIDNEEEVNDFSEYLQAILPLDRSYFLSAVKKAGESIRYADVSLRKDQILVLAAVKQYGLALQFADESLKKNIIIVLEAIKNNALALQYCDELFKNDLKVVLAAVKRNGLALQFADESLKKNPEIVLAAVKQDGHALQFADESLKKNPEIVLAAVKQDGHALQFADESLKKDKKIVLGAVRQNGWVLVDVDESLKKDKEVLLGAVKQNGLTLQYADVSLKKDIGITLSAVKQNGQALQYADESLKKDKEIVLAAVKQDGFALQFADASLKKDKEVVFNSVKQKGAALSNADESLKNNKTIVFAAIEDYPEALQYASESLKKNKEIVLAAIKKEAWALQYANESLKADLSFQEIAFNANINIYWRMPKKIKNRFTERYQKIINDLKEINIEFPTRLRSMNSIREIIKNRKDITVSDSRPLATSFYSRILKTLLEIIKPHKKLKEIDPRPLAVCISAKRSSNMAFDYNQIEELIAKGYRVIYFEAETDEEVFNDLIKATVNKPAELLVLMGHGTQNTIKYGGDELQSFSKKNEHYYIDVSDENKMRGLAQCLAKGSVVILESCSTGEGKGNTINIANLLSRVFPESNVFAPTMDTRVKKYVYDKNEKVIDVIYDIPKKNTYIIKKHPQN